MLFARLLESQRALEARRGTAEGMVVSAAAHTLLVAGWLVVHAGVEPPRPSPDETFTPVAFFVPPEQRPGLRPQQETVTWTSLTSTAGQGFAAPPEPPVTPTDRVAIEVPAGKTQAIATAPQALEQLPPIALGDSIKTELEVDSAAIRTEDGVAPRYPAALLRRKVEGAVLVQYVVDTLGRADTATFRVIMATHPEFARAVKASLPDMRFRPAVMASKRVAQLVQQPFAFRIVDTTRARVSRPPGVPPGDQRLPLVTSSQ